MENRNGKLHTCACLSFDLITHQDQDLETGSTKSGVYTQLAKGDGSRRYNNGYISSRPNTKGAGIDNGYFIFCIPLFLNLRFLLGSDEED